MRAKLLREEKIISLLGQNGVISGPVKPEDYLFFGTNSFFEEIFAPEIATSQEALSLKMEERVDKTLPLASLVLHIDQISPIGQISQIPAGQSPLGGAPLPQIHLRQPPKPSRKTLYAALLVLVFLISLVAFQLRSRNLETRTQNALSIENQAREQIDAAKKLAGLNDNLARDALTQAKKDLLTKAENTFGKDWPNQTSGEIKKLKNVLGELDNQLAIVSHAYTLENLESFSDFSLLRPDANITSASLNNNQIVVADSNNGAIYSLGTKTKTAAIVGGLTDFKQNPFVDFAGQNYYVFTPTGIYSEKKLLIKPSEKWGQIKGFKTFGGNLYLLDTANSQIWKYQGTDLGFGEIAPYLKAGGVDFSKVTSFAIDGSIFVLSGSGNIAKFSGGNSEDFTVSGLETPLSSPTSIFTSDETKNIYILDAGRVVILDKKGIYQAQYLLPTNRFSLTTNCLLADESLKKVFLFSASKVYSFDLK
jgi:hypothetical protein